MIKCTIQELIDANIAIQQMPKIPVKASYRFSRIREAIIPELRIFERHRDEIFASAGAERSGNTWSLTQEVQEKVRGEMEDLTSATVDVNVSAVRLSDLGDKVEIEPMILSMLSRFIEDGEQTDKKESA